MVKIRKKLVVIGLFICVFCPSIFQSSYVRGDYRYSSQFLNIGGFTLNASAYIIENVSIPGGNRPYHLVCQVNTNRTNFSFNTTQYIDDYILTEAGYTQFIDSKQTSQIASGNIIFQGDQINGGSFFGRCELGVTYYFLLISKSSSPQLVQYSFGTLVYEEDNLPIFIIIGLIGLSVALGIALIIVKYKK